MAGKFKWVKFANVNLDDPFFDSLKADYAEFCDWYSRKISSGAEALVAKDDVGITAFLYLKEECEEIQLVNQVIPAKKRVKIGTFKLDSRLKGVRQGEGTLGVALWRWQKLKVEEIYVTVFPKHDVLISLFEKFGFTCIGSNIRGEFVYIKSRFNLDFTTPLTAFPFIKTGFKKAYMLPINDEYHDKLFPYSQLQRNNLEVEEIAAGNGISKIFIGFPSSSVSYIEGKPILVYRIYKGKEFAAGYASCVTSFCSITSITKVREGGIYKMEFEEFVEKAGNKTVFSEDELRGFYYNKNNIILIGLVYNGYFGKGKNVIYNWMKSNGLFDYYPYQNQYTEEELIKVLNKGEIDVQNVIINQP